MDPKGKLEWEGVYGARLSDWAGEDICLTKDGGALVANDCGQFGFTKIEPFFDPGRKPKGIEKDAEGEAGNRAP